MEHWKRTIERANRCFMQGELVDAREAYLQAALRQSSKTYVELLSFISDHGEYPRTHRLLGGTAVQPTTSQYGAH